MAYGFGFLAGACTAITVVAVVFFWEDICAMPRVWRTEPDRHMRAWFVFVRRVVTGFAVVEPSWVISRPHKIRVRRFWPSLPGKPSSEVPHV